MGAVLDDMGEATGQHPPAGRAARIHLKIDTGLSRNGCPPEAWGDLLDAVEAARVAGDVEVAAVWSHLAHADAPAHPTIDVQAATGGGAAFRFTLPAHDGAPAAAPASGRPPGEAGPRRVVVMDDDDLVRGAAARMLTHLGCEALTARDGAELLEVPPRRPSQPWSVWSCGPDACGTPRRCGVRCAHGRARRPATPSGRTPTCSRPPPTSTTRWASARTCPRSPRSGGAAA